MADETLHITEDEKMCMPMLGSVLIRVKTAARGMLSEKQEI